MTKEMTDLIKRLQEKYPEDKDLKVLIRDYKYEADDEGDADEFFGRQIDRYFNGKCRNRGKKALEHIKFRSHRYLQDLINKFVFSYIKEIGAEDARYDGRNENSIKHLQKIRRLCEDNDLYL